MLPSLINAHVLSTLPPQFATQAFYSFQLTSFWIKLTFETLGCYILLPITFVAKEV